MEKIERISKFQAKITLQMKVRNMYGINAKMVSQEQTFNGISWSLIAKPYLIKDELYLGVFLRTFGDYSTINSNIVKAEIRLMSEDVDPFVHVIEHSYTKSNETVGTPRFIRYSELFDSKFGFINDDTIKLQAFMVGIQTRQAKLSDILDREFDKIKRQEEEKKAYEDANETFQEMRRKYFPTDPFSEFLKKSKETEKRATSTNSGATTSRVPFREVKKEKNANNRYAVHDAGSRLQELKENLKKYEEEMGYKNY